MKYMSSEVIRKTFIDYFKEQGHQLIPSSSLVPHNDPTLLWINAGVTPLKKYFDGREIPIAKRLVSVQKCIRTNDIDNVGLTARHLTFFEMLGNFSIGDYFKKEAVLFSFELLTKHFGFEPDKLYVTVYPTDTETYNLWLDVGVEPSHIIKLASNYWEIGPGPCGPDTEIFYDRGPEFDDKQLGIKLLEAEIENDRYFEIWNNVLSQYNAKEGLKREDYPELPSKNIDTGMGLERMACILQGVTTVYETDLFVPIIKAIENLSGVEYEGQLAFKVIADHIRTLVFALNDGATFSNEGRGYVLRRLLRRAVRYGKALYLEKPFMWQLVAAVIAKMEVSYPGLKNNQTKIEQLIFQEEKLFFRTLTSGEKRLQVISKKYQTEVPGVEVFKLYDTYGFPFELTQEILAEQGLTINLEEYNKEMKKQQARARRDRKGGSSMKIQNKAFLEFKLASKFIGDDQFTCETEVIGLIRGEELITELIDDGYVVLAETPFYAEGGGQAADIGVLIGENFKAQVVDVIKGPNKQPIHVVKVKEGTIKRGDKVTASIDLMRRESIMKNHSAAHLLLEALKESLSESISQAGASVGPNSLRFDFTYSGKITDEELVIAEKLVNDKIKTKVDTIIEEMPLEKALAKGAVALFLDKYEDVVRTVKLYDSFELCGGTHVKNVAEIERFAIKSITSKGVDVYRLEAVTADKIEEQLFAEIKPYNEEMKHLLEKAKRIMARAYNEGIKLVFTAEIDHTPPTSYRDVIFNRNEVETIRGQVKALEKEYILKQQQKIKEDLNKFDQYIKKNTQGEYLVLKLENYAPVVLKELVDKLTQKLTNGFVFIANVTGDNVNFIAKCHPEITAEVDCGNYVKVAAVKAKGNGGGSKTFAQGGGNDITALDEILAKIEAKIGKI